MTGKKSAHSRKTKPKQSAAQPAKSFQSETPYHVRATSLEEVEQRFQQMRLATKDWQRKASYQNLCREHPIRAKLESAFYVRAVRDIPVLLQTELQGQTNAKAVEEMGSLTFDLNELSTWLSGRRPSLPEDEIQSLVRAWTADAARANLPSNKILRGLQELEKIARGKLRGRPPERRPLAVTALEMKRANPRLSWTTLARKLCPPGRENNFQWRESLRQEVMALKKVLRKYNISY